MAYEFDLLVVGANPGGLAMVKEASKAGVKVALVNYRTMTPAEQEGYDEDLEEMEELLGEGFSEQTSTDRGLKVKKYSKESRVILDEGLPVTHGTEQKKGENRSHLLFKSPSSGDMSRTRSSRRSVNMNTVIWSRKLKKSRLDRNNVIIDMCPESFKLLHNAALLHDVAQDARQFGWRLPFIPPMTCNWKKLTERILDLTTAANWRLRNDLSQTKVEYLFGNFYFLDEHTVRVEQEGGVQDVTAEKICIALESRYLLPEHIPGAMDFGILPDDLLRLERPPGKTLIIGSTSAGVEIAGILAALHFPVTLMYRSEVLKGYDREIATMVATDLTNMGVIMLGGTTLLSVQLNNAGDRLLASYTVTTEEHEEVLGEEEDERDEEFDSVLFAMQKKMSTSVYDIINTGIQVENVTEKIPVLEEVTEVQNIYAVGDAVARVEEHYGTAELAGKLLARRLYYGDNTFMNYEMLPHVLFTPVEYAFIGCTEDACVSRLGAGCMDIYHGYYEPLEYGVTERQQSYFLKIIVLKLNDLVVGLHMYGPDAAEIIQGFAVAMKCGLTLCNLRTTPGVHTTKAEELVHVRARKGYETSPYTPNKVTRLVSVTRSLRL